MRSIIRLSRAFVVALLLASGCSSQDAGPSIHFTKIPRADAGGPNTQDIISGTVTGARPGQRVVLYARSGVWYVQPFADQPFTEIGPDGQWSSNTHLGTEYAALLVDADYRPMTVLDPLPAAAGGVTAVAVTGGTPPFWRRLWFRALAALAMLAAIAGLYRLRLRQVTNQLNVRFEERLAERTRIAQELHDTLLQGVISVSMQLHVAVDQLPADSPSRTPFTRVLDLMARVTDEGRKAVQGLRSAHGAQRELAEAFSWIGDELGIHDRMSFRVVVDGTPQPLHPIIRDDVYSIGREAVVNAFRHSKARTLEVDIEYSPAQLRVVVRDDGEGIDSQVMQSGRAGHWGLSGMRERADRIGARLKVWSRTGGGTEIELVVPHHVAFEARPAHRPRKWLSRLYAGGAGTHTEDSKAG